MPQTPDNLEQTLGEESITTTESGIIEGRVSLTLMENVRDSTIGIVDSGEKQEKIERLPEDSQDIMLTLLRHYPYIDNPAYRAYKELLDRKIAGKNVDEKEIEIAENACDCETDFEKLPIQLQNTITKLLGGGKNTLVIYDPTANQKFDEQTGNKIPDSGRIFTTIESLKKKFPSVQFKSFEEMLPGSDKKAWLLDSLADLSKNLSNVLSEIGWSDFIKGMDNVVLLSNRSYAHPFDLANKEKKTSMEESIAYLEKTGFVSYKGKYAYLKGKKKMIFNTYPLSIRNRENKLRAFQKAEEIQKRSLERKGWKGNSDAFIRKRELYFLEEQKEQKEQKISEKKSPIEHSVSLENIFDTNIGGKTGKFILRADVGNGKSFVITEIVKQIAQDVNKQVIFLEGKNFVYPSINIEVIKIMFEQAEKNGTIICIDAIDEILDTDIKKNLKDEIEAFEGQCFITARRSEFFSNTGFTHLHLKSLNTEDFLHSRFSDTPEGKEKINEILAKLKVISLHNEVEGNPLLLSFIVMLARDGEKYREKGVTSFKDIITKTDLYESILRLVLVEHEMLKGTNTNNIDVFDEKMDELGEYAYYLFKKQYSKNPNEVPRPPKKSILAQLNVLFSIDGNGNYLFIHNSFYEFFLAKYLIEMDKIGNRYLLELSNSESIEEGAEAKNIIMYWIEMVSREPINNIELLLDLLERLKMGSEKTGTALFFLNLEILTKIPDKINDHPIVIEIRNMYIEKISQWDISYYIIPELEEKFINNEFIFYDSILHDMIIDRICANNGRKRYIRRLLRRIGTDYALEKMIEVICDINRDGPYWNVYETHGELFQESTGDSPGVQFPLRGRIITIKNERYDELIYIYSQLLKTETELALEDAMQGAMIILIQGEYFKSTHFVVDSIMCLYDKTTPIIKNKMKHFFVEYFKKLLYIADNGDSVGIFGIIREIIKHPSMIKDFFQYLMNLYEKSVIKGILRHIPMLFSKGPPFLEEIENIIGSDPRYHLHLAQAFSLLNIQTKAIMYLDSYFDSFAKKLGNPPPPGSLSTISDGLELILQLSCWNNLRNNLAFQTLIKKYRGIIQDGENSPII